MIRIACAAAFVLGLAQEKEEGFVSLFNGKDLSGWGFFFKDKNHDASETFKVENGEVVCTGEPLGYMYTEKKYFDFTLRFDWKFERPEGLTDDSKFEGNSGYLIFIKEHRLMPRCIECQGANIEVGRAMFMAPPNGKTAYDRAARDKAVKPVGEWNTYEIVSKDGKVVISINGTQTTLVSEHHFKDPGPIGFQSEGAEIRWRNIRIKEE
jgi:hypothetical protein